MILFSKKIISGIAVAIAAATFSISGAEREKDFSYAPDGADPFVWGTGKVETYDVAILVKSPAFTGAKVTGFTVPISTDEEITNVTGWLSSELKLESKKNAPDIATVEAQIKHEGQYNMPQVYVTFNEPYTIPAEGVYVGYSLTVNKIVDENSKNPLIITYSDTEGGLFLHTTRTYLSWEDKAPSWGGVSMMKVNLWGEFSENAASPANLQTIHGIMNNEAMAKLTLTNNGESEIATIGYTYSINGHESDEKQFSLPTPIPAQLGAIADVELPLTVPSEMGKYDLSVTITTVNGNLNEDNSPTASGELNAYAFLPVNHPLVEEYTGTWCQWCPRGFIALERMKELYPDRFVALSYHTSSAGKEPMMCLDVLPNPSDDKNFPSLFFNRDTEEFDPYFGSTNNTQMGIIDDWEKFANAFTIADIDVKAEWADDNQTILKATSSVKFVKDCDESDYRISYALVGDNLTGEKWAGTVDLWYQVNGYSGNTSMTGDDWKVFTEAEGAVIGLVYNDIVLAYDDFNGVKGSLPENIVANETYEHSHSFDVSAVTNLFGEYIINDPSNLRVVAIVIDAKSGKAINCNSSKYPTSAGIDGVSADDSTEIVEIIWHDMQGRQLKNPANGIYIRTTVLSNGTTHSDKVVL